MIMVRELIHGAQKGRLHESAHMIAHGSEEGIRIPQLSVQEFIGVLLHPGEKPGNRLHKRVIVHDRIPLVSLQPLSRIPVMLRDDQSLRVGLLDFPAEGLPESVVELRALSQIGGNIETPAIRAERLADPFAGNGQDVIGQMLRPFIVQLRKRAVSPPSRVGAVVRPRGKVPVLKQEKIRIRRVRADISTLPVSLLPAVDLLAVHPLVERAAVVEHAVQNHPDPAAVRFLHELDEEPVRSLQVLFIRHPAHIAR